MPPEATGARVGERYGDLIQRLQRAVLEPTPGAATDAALRRAVEARAASLGGRAGSPAEVPAALASFVEKVARHAYEVTDDDVRALRERGYPEPAIFEIAASAAMGAGLARLERGLAALRGRV